MSITKTAMKLGPSIVALTTFSCMADSYDEPYAKEAPPASEVVSPKADNLPLLRTGTTQATAGQNSAWAANSGGTDIESESDWDSPPQQSGVGYVTSSASAAVTGASAQVSSSADVLGGGGSCGSLMPQGSAAMIGQASAPQSSNVWGPMAEYSGAASTGNQTFVVLDDDCSTSSGRPAIASGTVSVSGLPTSYTDTMRASASAGGSSVTVECQGPDNCTTTTVQQTVDECVDDPSELCTHTVTLTLPDTTGGAVSYSFLTSVGATIGLSANVSGRGSASSGYPANAGVDVTTSTSVTVSPL